MEVRHRPRRRDLKGEHLWNSCGSEAGKDERKQQKAEYENREGMHGKPGRRERRKPGSESGEAHRGSHCEAETGRTERKNRWLSSRKRRRSGRKNAEGKRKIRKAKAGSKHLWNSCGSEAGKGERKHTVEPSTETGKECTGNQAGENGENRGSESGNGALRKLL